MTFLKSIKYLLFITTLVSFSLFILEFLPINNIFNKVDFFRDKVALNEEYDPALARLNTLEKFKDYCDSIYNSLKPNVDKSASNGLYPGIVVQTIKQKFYHGYSHYEITDNYLAKILEPLFINKPVSAIVDPEDLVKYPMAACSQQSILFNRILTDNGYNVRKVGFNKPGFGGHFAQEVFYEGGWHFYDPNKEMDFAYLKTLNRPSVEFLANNPEILKKAYNKDAATMLQLFPTYSFGKPNKIEGLNALIFQKTTKILSFSIWILFFFLFVVVSKKEKKTSLYSIGSKDFSPIFFLPNKKIPSIRITG